MISFSFKVFLSLNVGVSFHVDGAKEIVSAGHKATLLCSHPDYIIKDCTFVSPLRKEYQIDKDTKYEDGRLHCHCNETSSLKQMTHHCGIVIENVLEKDEGTWKCNMDLVDKQSTNSHRINKVIDLNIRNRRQSSIRQRRNKRKRRDDRFSLYGGHGDEYGSGSGFGPDEDEIPRGPITISRGEVAQTIYDWTLVKTVAFDFKIKSRSRGRRSIAVLSDIGGYRCCSLRNAMFSVMIGWRRLILSIYGRPRIKLALLLRSWYRVEVHQGPPKDGERLITVDVNGKSLMSKEINEVTGLVRLFTSPNMGLKPAVGIIRAVTIIANEAEEYGTTTVKTTTINPDNIFLHADLLFDYYKVKIAHGTRMVAGTVRTFCELAGMKAVCTAGPGCSLNTAHCVNTPLSEATNCLYAMEGMSKVLCGRGYTGRGVSQCKQMDRIFSDLPPSKEYAFLDCGIVDEKYCAYGPTVTSLDGPKAFYGYCAKGRKH